MYRYVRVDISITRSFVFNRPEKILRTIMCVIIIYIVVACACVSVYFVRWKRFTRDTRCSSCTYLHSNIIRFRSRIIWRAYPLNYIPVSPTDTLCTQWLRSTTGRLSITQFHLWTNISVISRTYTASAKTNNN